MHVGTPLNPRDRSQLIVVCEPLNVLLNLACEEFCIFVHQGYWSVVLFSCSVHIWYQDNIGLLKWVWKCFLSSNFWEFEKPWYCFFFKCLVEFIGKSLVLDFPLLGNFWLLIKRLTILFITGLFLVISHCYLHIWCSAHLFQTLPAGFVWERHLSVGE